MEEKTLEYISAILIFICAFIQFGLLGFVIFRNLCQHKLAEEDRSVYHEDHVSIPMIPLERSE